MWEDNRKRRIIVNILAIVLIGAIAVGLGAAMTMVRNQTAAHDEELAKIYEQQQQEQTAARQESVDAIQAEYEKDMQTVAEYLPGIVCWGDSITLGSSGNTSYPAVLKTCLDTYFCEIYDFSSTIENAQDFARLKWSDYKVSVPVVNMGAASEDSYTVLGRAGAVPFVLRREVTIPADTETVEIQIRAENGKYVKPLAGGDIGVNSVHIAGVEGTMTMNGSRYYFTRSAEGEEVVAPAGTVVETAASERYRDYIHVVCIGTYGNFDTPQDLVNQVKKLLERQTKNTDRYLVLGLCSVYSNTEYVSMLNSIDTAMTQAFGNRYVNVRKYLIEDGLNDAGLSPAGSDAARAKSSMVPWSLMAAANSIELNGKAYTLLGKLIYDRMDTLGYFDEVYDELGIRETTTKIIKSNPHYFETILSSKLS